jgi:hypothetical protein
MTKEFQASVKQKYSSEASTAILSNQHPIHQNPLGILSYIAIKTTKRSRDKKASRSDYAHLPITSPLLARSNPIKFSQSRPSTPHQCFFSIFFHIFPSFFFFLFYTAAPSSHRHPTSGKAKPESQASDPSYYPHSPHRVEDRVLDRQLGGSEVGSATDMRYWLWR